jgi:dopamine receptor D1
LALIDRYLAINHTLLHRKKMTKRLASCLIITSSVFTVFLIKFVYIVQLSIIRCEILLIHVKMNAIIIITLFASCFVINIIIYRQTRTLLRESRTLQVTQDERDPSNRSANVNDDATAVTPMCIHVDRVKLGEMEMEATRTLMIGVASLCVVPCLALLFNATFFGCRLIYGQSACTNLLKIAPIIKEFSLTLAIYGPIIFLVRNKELRVAWTCKIINNNNKII